MGRPAAARGRMGEVDRPTCWHSRAAYSMKTPPTWSRPSSPRGSDGQRRLRRSPAHALRASAEREGAGLILVGSSRRGGVDRVPAGDDAAATLHWAPYAVAGAQPVER